MSYFTKHEKEVQKKNEHERYHGYWPNHPFIFMRKWYDFKESIRDWFKKRKCKKQGHDAGIILFVDGLPYPPHKNGSDKWDCSTVSGGLNIFRARCNHCSDWYDLVWPRINPEHSLTGYCNTHYPNAVLIYLKDFQGEKIRDQTERELERMNKILENIK